MIPNINLLPQYERQNIVLYRIFIIGLIIVLLTFVGFTYTFFYTINNIKKVEAENTQLAEQLTLLETQLASKSSNNPESLEAVVMFAEEYVIPTSMLIKELNHLLPNDAYLTTYEYQFGSVEIESQFDAKSDISTYTVHLLDSKYMDDVRVDHIEILNIANLETEYENTSLPKQKARFLLDINLAKLKEEAKQDE